MVDTIGWGGEASIVQGWADGELCVELPIAAILILILVSLDYSDNMAERWWSSFNPWRAEMKKR